AYRIERRCKACKLCIDTLRQLADAAQSDACSGSASVVVCDRLPQQITDRLCRMVCELRRFLNACGQLAQIAGDKIDRFCDAADRRTVPGYDLDIKLTVSQPDEPV